MHRLLFTDIISKNLSVCNMNTAPTFYKAGVFVSENIAERIGLK